MMFWLTVWLALWIVSCGLGIWGVAAWADPYKCRVLAVLVCLGLVLVASVIGYSFGGACGALVGLVLVDFTRAVQAIPGGRGWRAVAWAAVVGGIFGWWVVGPAIQFLRSACDVRVDV